jgi:hypothetical protein
MFKYNKRLIMTSPNDEDFEADDYYVSTDGNEYISGSDDGESHSWSRSLIDLDDDWKEA